MKIKNNVEFSYRIGLENSTFCTIIFYRTLGGSEQLQEIFIKIHLAR